MSDISPFPGPSTPTSPSPAAAATALPAGTPATKSLPNLPEHRHCEVCGRSMPMGNRVCSPECQKRFDDAVRARKRSVYIFVGLMGLLLFLSLYGGKLFGGA